MRSFRRRSPIWSLVCSLACGLLGIWEVPLVPAQQAPQTYYSAALPAAQQSKASRQIQIARQYQAKRAVVGEMTLAPPTQSVGVNQQIAITASCTQGFVCIDYRYFWGDTDNSDGEQGPATATHTYQEAGSYTLFATAQMRGNDRVVSVKSNTVTVTVTAPAPTTPTDTAPTPIVTLQADPLRATTAQAVHFSAAVTQAPSYAYYIARPPQNAYTLVYDYGDGTKSQPVTGDADYTYSAAGNYQATAAVVDGTGAVVATSNAVPISIVGIPPQLRVEETSGPTIQAGQPVSFLASVKPGVKDIEYRFHWNDGTPDSIAGPDGAIQHVFDVAGKREVQVTGLTSETFAGPISGSCLITVEQTVLARIPGILRNLARRYPIETLVIALGLLGGLATVLHRMRKARMARGLRFVHTVPTGSHVVRLTGPSYPQVSFSLKTGLENALHRVVVENGAQAASRTAAARKENHHG